MAIIKHDQANTHEPVNRRTAAKVAEYLRSIGQADAANAIEAHLDTIHESAKAERHSEHAETVATMRDAGANLPRKPKTVARVLTDTFGITSVDVYATPLTGTDAIAGRGYIGQNIEPTGEVLERAIADATAEMLANLAKQAREASTPGDGTPKPKRVSRPDRWADAIARAKSAMEDLMGVREEYAEWRENLPDSMEGTNTAEMLDAIVDLEFDEVMEKLEEADALDLPRGFGRD